MDDIKTLLIESKERGIPKNLLERPIKSDWMKNKANVFVGIRRSGKTYSLFQLMDSLKTKSIFYLNMEDERIIKPNITHLTNIIPTIHETFKTKTPIYLFVDEIQRIDGWERWVRRLAETPDVILFISGSSSKLSSFEIPTALRGRTITNYIFPLNFNEFLKFKRFTYDPKTIGSGPRKPKLLNLLDEYLIYGGFPEVVLTKNKTLKIKLLKEYFSTIISRDIIERHNVKNIMALETFIKYLVNNYSKYTSFSKTQQWMRSIGIKVGKATLIGYYQHIKQSFFANHVPIFSYRIKDVLQYPIKIYITDTGFINALTIKQQNMGWLYEQVVANELFKESVQNPMIEISYWKDQQHREVDFVIRNGMDVTQLIQVCLDISKPDTKKREVNALLKASEELGCNNLIVVTKDQNVKEKTKGKTINYISLWKWLLNK